MDPTPEKYFQLFHNAMKSFVEFEVVDLCSKVKYPSWKNDPPPPKQSSPRKHAMADHPQLRGKIRHYCQVEQRSVFESGNEKEGFVVQLEIHETPAAQRRTAVYVQSKEYPPSARNVGNLTFKFAKANGEFILKFLQNDTVAALKMTPPLWLGVGEFRIEPGKKETAVVQLGRAINNNLAQRLLLLADFSGQAWQNHKYVPRDPQRFYPFVSE